MKTPVLRTRARRRRAVRFAAAFGIGLAALVLTWASRVPYDRAALDFAPQSSVRLTARDGSPLRITLGGNGSRSEWVPLGDLSLRLVQATLAAEDRRFGRHLGIDPLAVLRATWINLRAGRIASGGSTLTQQLAGLLWPEPRTAGGKLQEAVRAVRLEMDLSKQAILEQYLNRVPYGPGACGAAAASRALFGRSPGALSASQAATLAALPQAPSRFATPAGRAALRRRRDAVLAAMARHGDLDAAAYAAACARDLELDPERPPFEAPHFADWVLATCPPALRRATRIETTLDATLQAEVEGIVAAHLAGLRGRGVHEMAVVVQAVASGEVLAMVGSPSWADAQVNGALALRQPGSALKPFVYAQAFAAGLSPADRLADLPLAALDGSGGEVAPRNYDGRWHGPVRAREALASSFNVPAVRVQLQLGTERVCDGLRAAGFESLAGDAQAYGLGLVLGVGEVTLLELTNAYAGLARGGLWLPPVAVAGAADAAGRMLALPPVPARRWLDPASAFLVADVLADDAARVPGFGARSILDLPFPAPVKTGTSTDYRNSWCVGFSRDHVVGVWVGNFDATPIHGLAGVSGAGPVFRSIMLRLSTQGSRPWSAAPPPGWQREAVCALSGDTPTGACTATVLEWFAPGSSPKRQRCTFHRREQGVVRVEWPAEYRDWARAAGLPDGGEAAVASAPRIVSPVDGSIYFRDPRLADAAAIRFAAESPQSDDEWLLDGRALAAARADAPILWPPQPGAHRLQLRRGEATAEVRFTVR